MEIGNYEVNDDGTYTIRIDKETYYSSENQDTIMIMWLLLNK